MLVHLTARTAFGTRPLSEPTEAWWLWRRLRANFPDAFAACLMPDHLHLLVDAEPRTAAETLARLLGAARRHRPAQCWGRVAEPSPIADARHLQRQVRYVHLNPCRSGLARDPLAWPWSTHRGLIGAEARAWVPVSRLAALFRRPEHDFARWFHGYVSSDPSVKVAGSALPTPCPPANLPVHSLPAIGAAALVATVWCAPFERRRAMVQLARHQGWRHNPDLAELCATSSRTVRRHAGDAPDVEILAAASMCLGDPRLSVPARPHAKIAHALTAGGLSFGAWTAVDSSSSPPP